MAGPTAKHDAAGASTRRMCPIAFGNHQYGLARPVSRLVGDSSHHPHTCCTSIRPGPRARLQSAAWCTGTRPRSNSPRLSSRPHIFDSICTFAPSVTIELVRIRLPACHEDGVPIPVTTGYRHLCRFLDKPADKPPMGSALAFARHRCRLYDLGALGGSAFLDGQCGLSKTFARRFVSHCRSLIRSGNHLPRPYVRKNKTPPALLFRAFHSACTHSPGGSARSRGGVVGSPQSRIGCLSESSKRFPGGAGHHGDNNQRSDVEVCDGRRRAH